VTLLAGRRLGRYEVRTPLGSGGTAEVYRALDTRLGREVAVKVIPPEAAANHERLRRLEQEAQVVASLDHPHILALHDVGTDDGTAYVVFELLEGETLRQRLERGPLAPRKAVEATVQICLGLAAAHGKGIIHRDLKPENLFVTREGRIKILDFGLAKLTEPVAHKAESDLDTPTATERGLLLGTAGYMSPEQVRGEPADARSDVFALGAVVYEMLSGRRAFRAPTRPQTLAAILTEDPPEVSLSGTVPPALVRVVRRCLEKDPEERFQSARDVAFALEAAVLSPGGGLAPAPADHTRRWRIAGALIAAAAVLGVVAFLAGRRSADVSVPRITALTFRRGNVPTARFTPDGQTVVYSAAWDGGGPEVFMTRVGSPESRALGVPGRLVAVSPAGELAIVQGPSGDRGWAIGTLIRVSLNGGVPREVAERVADACWSPTGALAVVRFEGGGFQLEYPIGHVLSRGLRSLSFLRFSPSGDRIAFLDESGLALVDLAGNKKTIVEAGSVFGLAWSPRGDELWFAAGEEPFLDLQAVTMQGRQRVVYRIAGHIGFQDLSRDGRVLWTSGFQRFGVMARGPGESAERDLTVLSSSYLLDLSMDGRLALIREESPGRGSYSLYARPTDGSPAKRISEGIAGSLSTDSRWVLAVLEGPPRRLVRVPTGAGQAEPIALGSIQPDWAVWFPDDRRILVCGRQPGRAESTFVLDSLATVPRPIAGVRICPTNRDAISPDGRLFAALDAEGKAKVFPVDGGDPHEIPALVPWTRPVQWAPDGSSMFVRDPLKVPARVYRVHLATGRKDFWKELDTPDPTATHSIGQVRLTRDGRYYAYGYERSLTDLYLVDGLR
jgi:eukaryotic-like serine/threonine-protein kinase